jgi:hypothetical protein
VFSGPGIPSGYTFRDALGYGGGNKAQILLRNAIGSVLNIASTEINYPLTMSELISKVNLALSGSDKDKTGLNEVLDEYNNLGCPF